MLVPSRATWKMTTGIPVSLGRASLSLWTTVPLDLLLNHYCSDVVSLSQAPFERLKKAIYKMDSRFVSAVLYRITDCSKLRYIMYTNPLNGEIIRQMSPASIFCEVLTKGIVIVKIGCNVGIFTGKNTDSNQRDD